jgi:RNA-dependent RNA polymerase
MHKDHLSHFIRVSFADEDLDRLRLSRYDSEPHEILKDILAEGLVLDKTYEYLGSSSSQFREHSAWFFARAGSISAWSIRAEVGDLTRIKEVGKYIARLGLAFSSTKAYDKEVKYVVIPDIERNGYCFTDGCGLISPDLAKNVSLGSISQYSEYLIMFTFSF